MNTFKHKTHGWKAGVSLIALGALAAFAAPSIALAQDAAVPPADDETAEVSDVIVTGTRRALQTSQNIRRNAETVVDSITATDIGAFPDKSVAEALQRVPGITVNRFAASDDTSHYGAEPSGVLVRGLQQVRSEYNGRDTFSANSSRGLSWGDISPELMQGVDVYKNQTAEMIEGGIAGTINLRTRVPFDAPGELIQMSATVNYGDLSKNYTPEASLIYSNRWDTSVGEFGFLANFAYSNVTTQSETIQYGRMGVFEEVFGPGTQYIPSSVANRDTEYDRERNGVALAGQWRSNDGRFEVTGQYNRSDFTNEWRERGIISYNADMFALPVDFTYTPGGARSTWIPSPGAGGEGRVQVGAATSTQRHASAACGPTTTVRVVASTSTTKRRSWCPRPSPRRWPTVTPHTPRWVPSSRPSRSCTGPGASPSRAVTQSAASSPGMKQTSCESGFTATRRPRVAARARTSAFARSPTGSRVAASRSGVAMWST
jgi:TonB-dependent receptor